MSEVTEVSTSPAELLSTGRRHLAVRDFNTAVETLAKACEVLAAEHGDMADQCAEAYLWYGKALLGLSREESGVFGEKVPGDANADEEEENEEDAENGEADQNEAAEQNGEAVEKESEADNAEVESTTKEEAASTVEADASMTEEAGASNDANDESMANLENEDDVENLQLAWEMLDLARNILRRRAEGGGDAARALLADAHLALGEVALESETYDKAVTDMQSCLEIQKELYKDDDRRIAETHYQIGLANSLASNFEDAITHFKNAANILESRIKTLESPSDDASAKQAEAADKAEIKELKELLPEIKEKIQDMMDYKTEVRKCDCVEETRRMLRDLIVKEKNRCQAHVEA